MSILSTSIYGSSTNKGVGGLLSGLDTDDLVKQMTAATRRKIDRQYQSKQKLLYRQEAYREVSSKLLTLSNKYFSYSSSKTNILSPSFFEANTFKSSSNYVNVTGNANNIKNFEITSIESVATAASFASTKAVASTTVKSDEITNYVSSLAGETMTLEYGGKSYSIKIDADFGKGSTEIGLQDVVDELNKQIEKADSSKPFKFELNGGIIESVGDDENKSVKLTAASKDIIDYLNFKTGQEAKSTEVIDADKISKLSMNKDSILFDKSSSIAFEYNGVLKTVNLKSKADLAEMFGVNESSINEQHVGQYIKGELEKAFGEGKIKFGYKSATNTFEFSAIGDNNIFGVSSISKDLSNLTGLESGDYNRVNKTKQLKDIGLNGLENRDSYKINVNGEEIDIDSSMSVTDIINKINNNAQAGVKVYYSATSNTFTVTATETGSHKGVSITDVSGEGNLAATLFGTAGTDYTINKGTDTVLSYKLNGVENKVTRSTANFTIDEINIELNEKAKDTASITSPITFDVTNNSDEVVERVKKFIEEYNEIIELIGTKTKDRPNREYPPLTPEQQEDMTEEEIKNWTAEAKKGILYGDTKMNSALQSLKGAMSSITDVSTLTLSSIGISSASMDTSGKLVLDEKKFKEKLLENPDEIAKLFTGTSSKGEDGISGIAVQLKQILVKNVGEYGNTGVLIDEAGLSGGMTADKNYISEKIKDHDDKMATLKKALEAERKRYWNQFAALENSLNKLNAQSSWLTDMMGN